MDHEIESTNITCNRVVFLKENLLFTFTQVSISRQWLHVVLRSSHFLPSIKHTSILIMLRWLSKNKLEFLNIHFNIILLSVLQINRCFSFISSRPFLSCFCFLCFILKVPFNPEGIDSCNDFAIFTFSHQSLFLRWGHPDITYNEKGSH